MLKRPVCVFLMECAGCGGCALEARAALTKPYGAASRGIRSVEASAHADVLVLCGPAPAPLAEEVQHLAETLTPPWSRIQLGDCAQEDPADIRVPGCPPSPEAILEAIVAAGKQRPRRQAKPGGEEAQ